jgi:hypothetical protein
MSTVNTKKHAAVPYKIDKMQFEVDASGTNCIATLTIKSLGPILAPANLLRGFRADRKQQLSRPS